MFQVSFRLSDHGCAGRERSSRAAQVGHACAKLDSKTQKMSARVRCFMTNGVSLLDKSKLFHKIFMSLLN